MKIYIGVFFFGDEGTGLADELKRTKRVLGWSRQIMGGRILLFAMLLHCEITRHARVHAYKARRLPL